MKILITYFTQTGNTEKIAYAMKDGLEGHNVELKRIDDTSSESLKDYEIVFLGSGIYAGKIKKTLTDLIKNAEELPPKFVFFYTHASPTALPKAFRIVRKKIMSLNSEIIREWDCRGRSIGISKEQTQAMLEALPPEDRKRAEEDQKALEERPNAKDLENAKAFAASIVK